MMIRWIMLLLALFPASASAKTLYVDAATGSDATSYAVNGSGAPWATVMRAAWGSTNPASKVSGEAAAAGDLVLLSAGTYGTTNTVTGCGDANARWAVALNPVNDGSSGNPIIFRAVGTVTILLSSGYVGPTIGASGKDYIVWDGITIDEGAAAGQSCGDTGSTVLFSTIGSQIINSHITGTDHSWDDNYNGIRLEQTLNARIYNNTITTILCASSPTFTSNCASIMLYDTESAIIEHNTLSNASTGIYVKGDHAADGWPQISNIVRRNWIENMTSHGINLAAGDSTQIYQNILKTVVNGIYIQDFGTPQSSNITIQNNTLISTNEASDSGISYAGTTNIDTMRAFNNILYGSFSEAINIGLANLGSNSYEHNLYNGYDAWGSVAGAVRTFATWQGTYGQDSASPAGITSDPLFVDTTYYKLQAGSPARSLGIDILNLAGGGTSGSVHAGAYLTGNETIGVEGQAPSTTTLGVSTLFGTITVGIQ